MLTRIGKLSLKFLSDLGNITIFASKAILHIFLPPFYFRAFFKNMIEIGYYSLPIIAMTAFFTGAVLALQSYVGFSRFNAVDSIATIVVMSLTRELGPVLGGLMITSRVGAAISAEIGSMKVTEQIDALQTLSVHPFKYMISPRILAGIISLPILVLVADVIGVYGGYLVSTTSLGFNSWAYLNNTFKLLYPKDIISGLLKAGVFGFIITLLGCYFGYNCKKGAHGVGLATTKTVAFSSMLILIINYILTALFFTDL